MKWRGLFERASCCVGHVALPGCAIVLGAFPLAHASEAAGNAHPPAVEVLRGAGDLSAVTVSKAADAPGRSIDVVLPKQHGAAKAKLRETSTRPARLPQAMMVTRGRITSGMGMRVHPVLGAVRMHSGVDLAARSGTPVVATSGGRIDIAGWSGGYGLLVVVDHGGGLQSRYGHLLQLAVAPGQQVRAGELLGFVGSTGRSTGPHLHYELRYNGFAFDPVARPPGTR